MQVLRHVLRLELPKVPKFRIQETSQNLFHFVKLNIGKQMVPCKITCIAEEVSFEWSQKLTFSKESMRPETVMSRLIGLGGGGGGG